MRMLLVSACLLLLSSCSTIAEIWGGAIDIIFSYR